MLYGHCPLVLILTPTRMYSILSGTRLSQHVIRHQICRVSGDDGIVLRPDLIESYCRSPLSSSSADSARACHESNNAA